VNTQGTAPPSWSLRSTFPERQLLQPIVVPADVMFPLESVAMWWPPPIMPGSLDAAGNLHRLAIDDEDVVAVADVEELCRGRPRRESRAKLRVGVTICFRNLPSGVNGLYAPFSRSAT